MNSIDLIKTFRAKLKEHACFGIFSKTTDSNFVEAAGFSGLDFIILDMEHGPASLEIAHNHVRASLVNEMLPIIRTKGADPHSIGSALDTGALGVQVPNISNASQAKEAIDAARFYPEGMRGVCRYVKAANFGSMDKHLYFKQANQSLLILQVEGVEGIKNLDEILSLKERPYCKAAIASGASDFKIIFSELVPNTMTTIIVNMSLTQATAILIESALSFLGFGDSSMVSWGLMLNNAQEFFRQSWYMVFFPGIGIFLVVLSLNLFGEGLNDVFNPRRKK